MQNYFFFGNFHINFQENSTNFSKNLKEIINPILIGTFIETVLPNNRTKEEVPQSSNVVFNRTVNELHEFH